ncbi:MAG: orotidine-5'-phosphate decarboxylase [Myxococcota bacterium]|nr:orotidine-5'-phosphate decarboxylase [Myxococcota bacterium]
MAVIGVVQPAPVERIIVALDSTSPEQLFPLVDALMNSGVQWFKVGLATWISGGPGFVDRLRAKGARVFLDLKLHDIPHQVRLATQSASNLGVELLTIHACGGAEMVAAARDGASAGMRVIAVTVLTSLDATVTDVICAGEKAVASGADGLVCSPREVKAVRQSLGGDVLLVTPGIRPSWSTRDDQKRIASPRAAIHWGSDLLVIGRPITQAQDPITAVQRILDELAA